MAPNPPPTSTSIIPDPDEDDLDELDSVLDDFSKPDASKSPPQKPVPQPSLSEGPTRSGAGAEAGKREEGKGPGGGDDGDDDIDEAAFFRELEKGMNEMLKVTGGPNAPTAPTGGAAAGGSFKGPGLGGGGGLGTGDPDDKAMEEEMMKMFEQMWKDTTQGGGPSASTSSAPGGSSSSPSTPKGEAGSKSFQDSVGETMRKLRESDRQAKDRHTTSTSTPSNPLAELLTGGAGGLSNLAGLGNLGDLGGDGDFEEMANALMEAMMSKELLYEGFKDLRDRYPPFLESPPSTLTPSDLERYTNQKDLISQILSKFDEPDWVDEPVPEDPSEDSSSSLPFPFGSSSGTGEAGAKEKEEEEELKKRERENKVKWEALTEVGRERQKRRKKEVAQMVVQMQEYGPPPKEILPEGGDLPPGFGLPGMSDECVIS